jgi:peptidyl-prolyl cis-trans isomerase SurA
MQLMKKLFFFLLVSTLWPATAHAQDEVLLTIDGLPVYRSEFERIYHKNNNIQGYEAKPPAEYLDMFINFKLKVLEATRLHYDTVPSFITELTGYRDQLSKPYLQDRQFIDQLIREAYYRTINEVNASHIMVKLPANATPQDTTLAYNKAMSIRKRLVHGESFELIATEESDDPSSRLNKGRLGWFSAFTMVYPFENAAYNTPVDSFSMPVRSRYGYHIIRVDQFRPALGEIKLAHIMVYAGANDGSGTIAYKKEKIDSCYQLLLNGASFADMVKKYSEDPGARRNMGQMRWLRSGELPSGIEDVVFALADSGDFSIPVQSEYGWHIFQLQTKRPIAPFEQLRPQLEERIMTDERGKKTQNSFIRNLKNEYSFTEYPQNITALERLMDSSVYKGQWKIPDAATLNLPVCSFANKKYTQRALAEFIAQTRHYNDHDSYQTIINRKYDELSNQELLSYEKGRLEEKYPDFKNLMEEYHDGILLFNIMDQTIWSRSVSDSSGLRDYYNHHLTEYQWKERADWSLYIVQDRRLAKSTLALAKKRYKTPINADEFIKMVCADSTACVTVTDQRTEKGNPLPVADALWKKGFTKTYTEGDRVKIFVVNDILPPKAKLFQETQGQVTADYQSSMDNKWIETLRKKYPVVINRDVLEKVK